MEWLNQFEETAVWFYESWILLGALAVVVQVLGRKNRK